MPLPSLEPSTPSTRAYSLIELIVVIAVVSVLAAILVPIFDSVRARAKANEDLDNIGQLARSAAIYAEDADKTFLCAGAPAPDYRWSPARDRTHDALGRPWTGWGIRLAPYTRSFDAFRSPLYPKSGHFEGPCAHASGMPLTNSYAVNWLLSSDGTAGDGTDAHDEYAWAPNGTVRWNRPQPLAEIVSPRNTVAFMLSSAVSPYNSSRGCLGVTVQASAFTTDLGRSAVTADGGNLAFADGHARFIADDHLSPFNGSERSFRVHHLRSRGAWMEPTMPQSTLGYSNADPEGSVVGDL